MMDTATLEAVADAIVEPSQNDFIATVGDVNAAVEAATDEIVDEINNVVCENIAAAEQGEQDKWLSITTQIQAQTAQLSLMTETLNSTQASVIAAMAAVTALQTQLLKEAMPAMEIPSQESIPLEPSPPVNPVANLPNPVEELSEVVAKPAEKLRRKWI